jgi:hypothetical protein
MTEYRGPLSDRLELKRIPISSETRERLRQRTFEIIEQEQRAQLFRKLDYLCGLTGLYGPRGDFDPVNPEAAQHFRDFVEAMPADRFRDAEPTLTDEGRIRMEWDREGYSYIAEIGQSDLYLCALAPLPESDDDLELERYDGARLLAFFVDGQLRPPQND